MTQRIIQRLRRWSDLLGFERDWYMIVLGAVIGTITGVGAIGFMKGLRLTEAYCDGLQGGFPLWPWLMPLIPMAGALITGYLVHFYATEARGHGVPEVMRALLAHKGIIQLRVGIVKVVASIFSVGTGGSAGAEGPIIQIGATAGSVFGQRLNVDRSQMTTLIGCGSAAGIASVFNAPIAGVFFALEIILRDFSLKTFTPVVVASVFSTAVTQGILGKNDALFAPSDQLAKYVFNPAELPAYVVLGIICGVVAVGFASMLHKAEDVYERMRLHPVFKPVTGALVLGLLGSIFLIVIGPLGGVVTKVPPFFGNGYDIIRQILNPVTYSSSADVHTFGSTAVSIAAILLLMMVMKCLATVFTLGSGGSGGVFAPSLFLGATVGGAFGLLLRQTGLMPANGSPAAYALVGMAAVVAGSTHAPLTSILMLFELTRDVYVLLPIMLAAVVATVVSQLIFPDSIYTTKLRRAGLRIGSARDLMVMRRIPVSSCQITPLPPEPVYPSDPLSKLITLHAYHSVPDFVVVDQGGEYVGMVTGSDMRSALIDREAIPLLLVAELLRSDLPTVSRSENLDTVLDKFARLDISSLPLVEDRNGKKPIGLISRAKAMQRYQEALED